MKPVIQFRQVSKAYETLTAVDGVSLEVREGTILALLGPSGCGKTTTLRLIAGLEVPDAGEIWLGGRCAAAPNCWLPPEQRQIGMVFQDYALFPHLTLEGNINFALQGWSRGERKARVIEMLALVGLDHAAKRFPHQLSGGQQQRVALARAMAARPQLVLLDEPFSNLDAALRKTTREEVRHILRQAAATAIFVTHDQDEAMSIADLIGVMQQGRLVQLGTPRTLYEEPISAEVALFLGDANRLTGMAQGEQVITPLGALSLRRPQQGRVDVLIRPEDLIIEGAGSAGCSAWVQESIYYGHRQTLLLRLEDATLLRANLHAAERFSPGSQVSVGVRGAVLAFPVSPA